MSCANALQHWRLTLAIPKSKLASIVDALEDRLISDIDRRVAKLSKRDRELYERWLNDCSAHFAAHHTGEPGSYWGGILDGTLQRPQLPYWIDRQLHPELQDFDGKSVEELQELYREACK